MARELPIFPLPIVLFPGAPQPLHVFEPRYRQLLADCLAADRRFGIAYVPAERDAGVEPLPRPGDVGCVAVIRNTQGLPDGRSNVLTVGERRFVLRSEEHTSELQSRLHLVCRLLLEKKKKTAR